MRVTRGVTSHARHKKIFRANKGYRMTKRRLIRVATESFLHAGEYAFAGRKQKKRDFKRLWIGRISSAIQAYNLNYSRFINALKEKNVTIDRKMLAILASDYPTVFDAVAKTVQK